MSVHESELGWDRRMSVAQPPRGIPVADKKHTGIMAKHIGQMMPKPKIPARPRAKAGPRRAPGHSRGLVSDNKVHTGLATGVFY